MKNEKVLVLHHLRFFSGLEIEQEVCGAVDKFLHPLLLNRNNYSPVKIIVGKGLNSKKFIKGKNPLRHYTENYLNRLGLEWKNGDFYNGGDGVILVNL